MQALQQLAAAVVALAAVAAAAATDPDADSRLVQKHVAANANATFRPPSGSLRYPYLVPAGPYNEMWDWDSMFMGVALLPYGSLPYFAGTFMNFLDHTNVTDGEVQGCLVPSGATGTIYHAKPLLIQAGWLACVHAAKQGAATGKEVLAGFRKFKPQMEALLKYWEQPPRKDPATGLYVWHDQLQTGADDLVTSNCPSKYSKCWTESVDAYTLATVDMHVFLHREHAAFAKFSTAWAAAAEEEEGEEREEEVAGLRAAARQHETAAAGILATMEKYLWSESDGRYIGRH